MSWRARTSVAEARAWRSTSRAALLSLLAWGACGTPSGRMNPTFDLAALCAADACPTTGSARFTTGVIANTEGLVLGPGPGQVTLPIASNLSSDRGVTIQVLAAATSGSFVATVTGGDAGPSTQRWQPARDFQWLTVADCGGSSCATSIQVATDDATSVVQIADLQVIENSVFLGCE
jgi:hypothetical protein